MPHFSLNQHHAVAVLQCQKIKLKSMLLTEKKTKNINFSLSHIKYMGQRKLSQDII